MAVKIRDLQLKKWTKCFFEKCHLFQFLCKNIHQVGCTEKSRNIPLKFQTTIPFIRLQIYILVQSTGALKTVKCPEIKPETFCIFCGFKVQRDKFLDAQQKARSTCSIVMTSVTKSVNCSTFKIIRHLTNEVQRHLILCLTTH